MELCEGSLHDYINGKIESIPKDSLDDKIILGQVCLGLAYIHSKKMIHKDLKPGNILMWQRRNVVLAKIADFGFAKQLKQEIQCPEFSDTANGGTSIYMAPELLQQEDEFSTKERPYKPTFESDIYALGITIAVTVLKGNHPHERNTQIMKFGIEPFNLKGLDWDITDLILQLTKREPQKRPKASIIIYHPFFILNNEKAVLHFEDKFSSFSFLLSFQEYDEMLNDDNVLSWVQSILKQQEEESKNNVICLKEVSFHAVILSNI